MPLILLKTPDDGESKAVTEEKNCNAEVDQTKGYKNEVKEEAAKETGCEDQGCRPEAR
jgi:hypothetical protein